jgi:Cft2 family RNA processing exonuclease
MTSAGLHLPELGLWLDPRRRQNGPERVFVSHAHADHTGKHREVILTEPTAHFMRVRLGGQRVEHRLPLGERRAFVHAGGEFQITLLPAGHILGSAMSLVQTAAGSLLYTGDFQPGPSLSAEPCDARLARGCDTLIMESTFGRPQFCFPPARKVLDDIIGFCQAGLAAGETCVLLAYSLGKSQELLCGLAGAGLPLVLHSQARKLISIYEAAGRRFPAYETFDAHTARGKVLICPPNLARAKQVERLAPLRSAVVTGWAVESSCRFRYGVDAAFPLSDHADFDELVAFVQELAPRKVYTVHGYAADFARTLRDLGFDAQALGQAEQLDLKLAP